MLLAWSTCISNCLNLNVVQLAVLNLVRAAVLVNAHLIPKIYTLWGWSWLSLGTDMLSDLLMVLITWSRERTLCMLVYLMCLVILWVLVSLVMVAVIQTSLLHHSWSLSSIRRWTTKWLAPTCLYISLVATSECTWLLRSTIMRRIIFKFHGLLS